MVEDLVNGEARERGIMTFDAYFKREVVVVAPVLCILADRT
jgi:hypothetical protein